MKNIFLMEQLNTVTKKEITEKRHKFIEQFWIGFTKNGIEMLEKQMGQA